MEEEECVMESGEAAPDHGFLIPAITVTPTAPTPPPHYQSPHCRQVSHSEYLQQATDYTQRALKELQSSPEYKQHIQRCHSCGASWFEGQWSECCTECGGCAMHRSCPICLAKCGNIWTRSIDMSHRLHEAHWDGRCGLGLEQQAAYMLRNLVQPSCAELAQAIQDLHT